MTDSPQPNGQQLRTDVEEQDNAMCLSLFGEADMTVMSQLDTVLQDVHGRVSGKKPELVVDLRELDFMNSSCFKCFVVLLRRVQQLPQPDRYRIRFLSDPSKHWQRRSLHALSCFAVDLVQVETAASD